MRVEDIDRERSQKTFQMQQLAELAELGLVADDLVVQSDAQNFHYEFFRQAWADGALYPCTCSRKDVQGALAQMASAPHSALPTYSGRCRAGAAALRGDSVAWRFRSSMDAHGAQDFIVGRSPTLEPTAHDFRPAYLWACALDDARGGYDLLVRAWDLAHVMAPMGEIFALYARLQACALYRPAVFHCALVVDENGRRLEKRARAYFWTALRGAYPADEMREILRRSCDEKLWTALAPGKIFGEKNETISVKDLLACKVLF